MNERIKELLIDSGGYYGGEDHLTHHRRFHTDDVNYERFARLIIEECMDLFNSDPKSMTRYSGIGVREMIKSYFLKN